MVKKARDPQNSEKYNESDDESTPQDIASSSANKAVIALVLTKTLYVNLYAIYIYRKNTLILEPIRQPIRHIYIYIYIYSYFTAIYSHFIARYSYTIAVT